MSEKKRAYLGDSVYAEWIGGQAWLYLDNGLGPNSHICLEPEVYAELRNFWEQQTGGSEFLRGVIAGLTAFAWWKDGTQYVGTCGTTLKAAIEAARKGELHL